MTKCGVWHKQQGVSENLKRKHAASGWRDKKIYIVLTMAYFYCSFSPVKKEWDIITVCFLHSASSLQKLRNKNQLCQMCYSKFDLQGEKNLRQCAQTNVLELALEKHWLVTEKKKKITS